MEKQADFSPSSRIELLVVIGQVMDPKIKDKMCKYRLFLTNRNPNRIIWSSSLIKPPEICVQLATDLYSPKEESKLRYLSRLPKLPSPRIASDLKLLVATFNSAKLKTLTSEVEQHNHLEKTHSTSLPSSCAGQPQNMMNCLTVTASPPVTTQVKRNR
ncbi:hypothetical protein EUGRSUZ_H04293 [Eucalyptus grandis]|uniref:Uncharacterized protein n=2 Tax=Eucalyptus grandis TaxID=71139 RepID=A0ACC3JVQ6_EUCGR|nr:hypothetical protein EUGRSUZ_H04293 [Eucalyptus grandis]